MIYSTAAPKAIAMMRRAALCALLGLGLLAGFSPKVAAATASPFVVTRTADDTSPGSLRSAIALAAGTGGTITFAIPNTDPGYSSAANTDTITLALGELDIADSLSISGPSIPSGAIIVSGANQSRVFNIGKGTVSFSNLTIRNGSAPSNFDPFHMSTGTLGGGILNSAALTMTNCIVSQSAAFAGFGGGIANNGTLLLTGCTITGNSVNSSSGGFSYGGGLANSGTGIVTLNNCIFSSNSASLKVSSSSTVGGAGIANFGILNMSNCLITGNNCNIVGGGIDNGGTLNLNACTITNNRGGDFYNGLGKGGGINNQSTGAAQITNCLVNSNSSYLAGGMNNEGSLTLTNSTFANNLVFSGSTGIRIGGLLSGPATLTNDIFYFDTNYATGSAAVSEIGTAGTTGPTVTFSDVQGSYTGTGNISTDPQFVRNPNTNTASDNGDEHLKLISPAVHTGTNGPMVPLTDIEGTPRPAPPATPSMGAYEVPGAMSFSAQGGYTVTGTQGQDTGAQIVAKFLPGPTPIAGFTAMIDFGDGTVVPGAISPDLTASGVFQITGSHTYTGYGSFPITVTISGPGGKPAATVTSSAAIQPVLAALAFPSPVPGGTVVTATVTLSGPALADTVVGLSSSDSSVVRLFRAVTVPAGSSSATFAINTFRSHATKTVTITAALGAVTLAKDLTITGR